MKTETKDINEIYIEFYQDLLKKYEILIENLIEILKQLKTDCREQSVIELSKQLNAYLECQNFQKANYDTVQEY